MDEGPGIRIVSVPTLFELEAVGGPWGKRLARRRAGLHALPWSEAAGDASPEALAAGRWVWTQSAFSEYASAAAFAEIASSLLAAGAPIDLVAAAGDFVVDEVIHAELSARVAMSLGGAVRLEVDLGRLVRPPDSPVPLVRAAELLVRTSCVGEVLTLPILKTARARAGSPLIEAVITRIARDESSHAQLGPWFLDWAGDRLSVADRAYLGRVAGAAVRAFVPIFSDRCAAPSATLGVLDCDSYDVAFADAVRRRVVAPLRDRGIVIPEADLAGVPAVSVKAAQRKA
jgi:hypothetical protein